MNTIRKSGKGHGARGGVWPADCGGNCAFWPVPSRSRGFCHFVEFRPTWLSRRSSSWSQAAFNPVFVGTQGLRHKAFCVAQIVTCLPTTCAVLLRRFGVWFWAFVLSEEQSEKHSEEQLEEHFENTSRSHLFFSSCCLFLYILISFFFFPFLYLFFFHHLDLTLSK